MFLKPIINQHFKLEDQIELGLFALRHDGLERLVLASMQHLRYQISALNPHYTNFVIEFTEHQTNLKALQSLLSLLNEAKETAQQPPQPTGDSK